MKNPRLGRGIFIFGRETAIDRRQSAGWKSREGNRFFLTAGEKHDNLHTVYGDNVFEKDGIRRDRTGDGEKTRCLCGKRGIFNRDGPAMGPQIIRQLE